MEASINESVLIDCCVQGRVTNLMWYKDGTTLQEKVAGTESQVLVIPSLEFSDSGLYTCIIGEAMKVSVIHYFLNVTGIVRLYIIIVIITFLIYNYCLQV